MTENPWVMLRVTAIMERFDTETPLIKPFKGPGHKGVMSNFSLRLGRVFCLKIICQPSDYFSFWQVAQFIWKAPCLCLSCFVSNFGHMGRACEWKFPNKKMTSL